MSCRVGIARVELECLERGGASEPARETLPLDFPTRAKLPDDGRALETV